MSVRIHLGIECGGTRTVALASRGAERQLVARVEAGAANLRLVSDAELETHFRGLKSALPEPSSIGVGMAGVRTATDCARITRILGTVWPGVPSRVDHDLVSALEAASMEGRDALATRVVVLSGTGSCCFGRNASGRTAKLGGWGHLLGDRGSGYDIAHSALRRMIDRQERTASSGKLGALLLRALVMNDLEPLVGWIQGASKREVAALAPLVFEAAAAGDRGARTVIESSLGGLLELAVAAAKRLRGPGRKASVEFVLAGSVFSKQPGWVPFITRRLRMGYPGARVRVLERESAWGAVALAEQVSGSPVEGTVPKPFLIPIPEATQMSPTECRNPKSSDLDRLPVSQAIRLMLEEDSTVPVALLGQVTAMEKLIRLAARSLKTGGRLFYVGAGTSGRLGVLDASECPPTFRSPPQWVQGIMAGGEKALHSAVEGAEDDAAAGVSAMGAREVGENDLVVGIAASGRTPFVWGALHAARAAGARTALVCFNPHLKFQKGTRPDVLLAIDVGPEILTGSTRLKAGTATKLILNILTTLTMVRLGKVVGNRMIDLNPSNVKLRDRAVRIACEISGVSQAEAQVALDASGWNLRVALESIGRRPRK